MEKIFPIDLFSDYEKISSVVFPVVPNNQIITYPSPTQRDVTKNSYAILISAYGNPNQELLFYTPTSTMYNLLIEQGFSDSNIIVLYNDGTAISLDQDLNTYEVDAPAYNANISQTFMNLSGAINTDPDIPELQIGDNLFVYILAHGDTNNNGDSYFITPGEVFFDTALSNLLENIKASQMTFVLQNCKSGGFIDNLSNTVTAQCKNRMIITACDVDESSYFEFYITPLNTQIQRYPEFSFYFQAALRSCYSVPETPWLAWEDIGSFDFSQYFANHPLDYIPDSVNNNDGETQLIEAFMYSNDFDTYSTYGYLNPWDGTAPSRFIETPQIHPPLENPTIFSKYATLLGMAGNFTVTDFGANPILDGNYLFSGDFIVENGVNLTVSEGSNLSLSSLGKLIIENGASLTIENNCSIQGSDNDNSVVVYGDLNIGNNVVFSSLTTTEWGGLHIENSNVNILSNNVFENCSLFSKNGELVLNNCEFLNSEISTEFSSVEINNSDFTDSYIHSTAYGLYQTLPSFICEGNTFVNQVNTDVISISNFSDYSISDNKINTPGTAIKIYYSGSGKTRLVSDNNIYGSDIGDGILFYDSYAEVIGHNNIADKNIGIYGLNNCLLNIIGDVSSPYQEIHNNSSDELKFSYDSFPIRLNYNKIYDDKS